MDPRRGGRGGHAPSPGPVKITHKKDGHQRRLHRFHVSAPPTPIRPLDPLLMGSCSCPDYQQCMFTSASQNVAFVHQQSFSVTYSRTGLCTINNASSRHDCHVLLLTIRKVSYHQKLKTFIQDFTMGIHAPTPPLVFVCTYIHCQGHRKAKCNQCQGHYKAI